MTPTRLLLAFAALVLAATPAAAQLEPIPQDRGGNGLGLALRRIGVTPRVLWVTAHPDDEDNGVLVRLSRGQGVRTALLTLTRGDGGQNAIGPELSDALGVLRTEELAAIHRYDAVEQYFGASSDFGYSYSVEETLSRWGPDAALQDVVRVVRAFRPDVIVTLPLEAPGGGQAHQAAGRLARDAFRAAADPARFPDLGPPWQARKLYRGGVGGGPSGDAEGAVVIPTAVYDPLLGHTWQQFGRLARALHRSQATSQATAPPGPGEARFVLLDSEPAVSGAEDDLLAGFDLTIAGVLRLVPDHAQTAPFLGPGLAGVQARIDAARAAFDATAPEKTLPSLQAVLAGLRALGDQLRAVKTLPPALRDEVGARLYDEEVDTEAAITLAHGITFESIADDDVVVPGQVFTVTTTATNHSPEPIQVEGIALALTPGWTVSQRLGTRPRLGRGQSSVYVHQVLVPENAPPSQPHWRRTPGADRFAVPAPALAGRPWAPPDVVAHMRYHSGGVMTRVARPTMTRYEWAGGGEKQKVVSVVPPIAVRVEPEITVVPAGTRAPREVRVAVRNERRGPATGRVRIDAPAGFTVEPREAPLAFRHEGEEKAARFTLTPPAAAPPRTRVRAVFVDDAGREFSAGDQVVSHAHVHERRLVRPAEAVVIGLDVKVPAGVSVGYVEGTGDEVDSAIRQLGVPVTALTPDDLAFSDLTRFTTIVTGIRAYQVRPDLRSYHDRLLRYAEAGGNLVVLYNRADFNRADPSTAVAPPEPGAPPPDSPFAPYPASVTAARITDETAAPRVLAPDSRLLNAPNRIGPADWEGWVQERGLSFLDARDPRYQEVVSFTDPFPLNAGEKKGALVDAPLGRGRWTYVGLGLFRQLPAGVPGAWRLLANLVGRPRGR